MSRSRRTTIPLPLWLLGGAAVVLSLTWAILEPPLQAPDEARHFSYTQRIVEQREIPWHIGGDLSDAGSAVSTEVETAQLYAGLQGLAGNPTAKDNRTAEDERFWRHAEARLPAGSRGDGGVTSAMRNPPLYYLYAAVPYTVASPGGFFAQSFVMRLANVPLLIAVLAASWVLTGLLLGPVRWAQTLSTGVVALNAQLVSISAGVGPDLLLAAIYSAALCLMALILLRGATRPRLLMLAVLCVLAGATQARGTAVVVPALLTAAIAWWRAAGPHDARARRLAVASGTVAVVASVTVATLVATRGAASVSAVREFASYLWQFYLPRLGFMSPTPRADWSVRDVFVDRFWGIFGQFDTFVAPGVMNLVAAAALAGSLALAVALVARRSVVAHSRALLAVLAVAVVSYLGLLHVVAWRTLQVDLSDPVLTGRYLLPFLPLLGVAVAFIAGRLPRRFSPAVAGVILSAALALQFAALGAVLVRMHA